MDKDEVQLSGCEEDFEELLIDRGSRTEESDKDAEEGMTIWDCAKDKRLSNAVTKVFKSTVGSDAVAPAPINPCWGTLLLAIFCEQFLITFFPVYESTQGYKNNSGFLTIPLVAPLLFSNRYKYIVVRQLRVKCVYTSIFDKSCKIA